MSEQTMSREKQIEEMADLITHFKYDYAVHHKNATHHKIATSEDIAEALYNKGYRKQSENTVELPCKVGDTVYRISKRRGVWCILPREVVSLTYRLDHLHRVVWEIFSTETDVLGKSVFLTEDEAEQALAKMKGGAE